MIGEHLRHEKTMVVSMGATISIRMGVIAFFS